MTLTPASITIIKSRALFVSLYHELEFVIIWKYYSGATSIMIGDYHMMLVLLGDNLYMCIMELHYTNHQYMRTCGMPNNREISSLLQ